jgi:acetyltransferase-like isoleucine patch superfamily enzyme
MSSLKSKITSNLFLSAINSIYRNYFETRRHRFGFIDHTARVRFPIHIKGIENVYIYENSQILGHAVIITTKAKFIMKKNSSASEGLTIVTGNHPIIKGELFILKAAKDIQTAKDVVIEEDVGIGTNVTLLSGVIIGRGAIIGSGAVVRNSIPPYAIVAGNPAKIIGFRFTPKDIIEHESIIYSEDERMNPDLLNTNYHKYFIKRIKEIKSFIE